MPLHVANFCPSLVSQVRFDQLQLRSMVTSAVHPNWNLTESLLSSGMTLDQEMKETKMDSVSKTKVAQAKDIDDDDGMDKDSSALRIGITAAVSHAVAHETSTDSKADEQDQIFAAKNLFARTATNVFSVLNRGAVKESDSAAADEMESYEGDGHSPRNFEEQVDEANESCSRDEWAAARDDIDYIINDTAQSVRTARLRAASDDHKKVWDPKRTPNEREDAIVTMGSMRSVLDEEEFGTIEETRQPCETGASSPKQKMWEKLRTMAERSRAVRS